MSTIGSRLAQAKPKIVISGGTGQVGKALAKGCLAHGGYASVSVLTRKAAGEAALSLKALGAHIVEVDAEDQAALTAVLKGADIVVSTVGGAGVGSQITLLEASKAAGVRRFVPCEWGVDFDALPSRDYFFLADAKMPVRDAVEASGLEWTYVVCGMFMDTTFSPFFGWNVDAGKIVIKGDPNKKFTVTSVEDTGKLAAAALLHPSSKNATVRLRGQNLTWNKAVKIFKKAYPEKKFDVQYVSYDNLLAEIKAAPSPWAVFGEALQKVVSDGNMLLRKPVFKGPTVPHSKRVKLDAFIAAGAAFRNP